MITTFCFWWGRGERGGVGEGEGGGQRGSVYSSIPLERTQLRSFVHFDKEKQITVLIEGVYLGL